MQGRLLERPDVKWWNVEWCAGGKLFTSVQRRHRHIYIKSYSRRLCPAWLTVRHDPAITQLRPMWIKYCLPVLNYQHKCNSQLSEQSYGEGGHEQERRIEDVIRERRRNSSVVSADALWRAVSLRAFWRRRGSPLLWPNSGGRSTIGGEGRIVLSRFTTQTHTHTQSHWCTVSWLCSLWMQEITMACPSSWVGCWCSNSLIFSDQKKSAGHWSWLQGLEQPCWSKRKAVSVVTKGLVGRVSWRACLRVHMETAATARCHLHSSGKKKPHRSWWLAPEIQPPHKRSNHKKRWSA